MLGAPEVDTVLQARSRESRVEGQNHLPWPVGHNCLDAIQDMIGHLGCKHMLFDHVESSIDTLQPVYVLGIAPIQMQDLALGLVELQEVGMGPPLKPAQVPLVGISSL